MDSSPVPTTHYTDAPKRFECHDGPDVTVVVGGVEFEEYSHSLRLWSGYFDAAFRSGMKPSGLSFPTRIPESGNSFANCSFRFPKRKLTRPTMLSCTRGSLSSVPPLDCWSVTKSWTRSLMMR